MIVIQSRSVANSTMASYVFFLPLIFFSTLSNAKVMVSNDFNNTFQGDHAKQDEGSKMDCIDWEGKLVADGEKYIPYRSDLCLQCVCAKHFPDPCQSVACSAPQNCANARLVPGKCCEYECLSEVPHDNGNSTKEKDPSNETKESITNLSLRLIASTVTSLLFLALLLFMVYRLRQRRLLLAMRRFEARSRNSSMVINNDDTGSEHFIPENFLALECPPYTDPPPPYSPPKPPHIYMGEQPPAYDEISLAGETAELANGGRPPQPRRAGTCGEVVTGSIPQQEVQTGEVSSARRIPAASNERNPTSPMCPEGSLPAYASTDVVNNGSTTLSPPTSGLERHWDEWNTDGLGLPLQQQDWLHERNGNAVTSYSHQNSADRSASRRLNPPPVTAFQRFSSLFKRNAPKFKARNGHNRPVSECPQLSYYATIPHNDFGAHLPSAAYTSFGNSNRRSRNSTRSSARSLTDRMCFSYDSARAAYELAAMSPSTSSNSSSSGGIGSCSPRAREISHQNPLHSQQFQDDLRRHLPPLQTSDSSELLAQSSPGTCQSTLSPSWSSVNQSILSQPGPNSSNSLEQSASSQCHAQPNEVFSENRIPYERETTTSIIYDLTGSLPHVKSSSCSPIQSQTQQPARTEGRQNASLDAVQTSSTHRMLSCPQNSSPGHPSIPSPSGRHASPVHSSEGEEASPSLALNSSSMRNEKMPPSPPIQAGLLRRSLSAQSEVSMFSVCSETGEKKLRDGESAGADPKVLASDYQFPDHCSLSTSGAPSTPQSKEFSTLQNTSANDTRLADCVTDAVDLEVDPCSKPSPATLFIPSNAKPGKEGRKEEQVIKANQEVQTVNTSQNKCSGPNSLNSGLKVVMENKQRSDMSSNLPQCSSSQYVMAHMGKLIVDSHRKPKSDSVVNADAKLTAGGKHVHPEGKKIKRKKTDKEKHHHTNLNHSNSHTNQKSKHPASSNPGASSSNLVKPDVPSRNSKLRPSSKQHSSRSGERKKRSVGSLAPHVENSEPLPPPQRMIQSYDDTFMGVGNADVYRNYGCDVTSPSSVLPNEYSCPHHHVDTKFAVGSNRDHCDVPLAYKSLASTDRIVSHAKQGHADMPSLPPATKRKPAHKRQLSMGDQVPWNNSPSRQRPRTKSSVCPLDRGPSNKGDVEVSSFEQGPSVGKGAKSGFGHDLNFDDQMGMMDFFNEGVDYSSTKPRGRASFGNDSCMPLASNVRSSTRGIGEVGNQGQGQSSSSNRSGLSNDLSFVNGSCHTGEKSKKRASLPSLPIFSHGAMNSGLKSHSSKFIERAERGGERRRDEGVQNSDYSHATSYV